MKYVLKKSFKELHGDVAHDLAALDRQINRFFEHMDEYSQIIDVFDDFDSVKKEFESYDSECGVFLNNENNKTAYVVIVYVYEYETDDDFENDTNCDCCLMTDVADKIFECPDVVDESNFLFHLKFVVGDRIAFIAQDNFLSSLCSCSGGHSAAELLNLLK